MNWVSLLLAAFQTLGQLSPSIIPLFHGGAAQTAGKIASSLNIVQAFAAGTLHAASQDDLAGLAHPDLAAHAANIDAAHATLQQPGI